MLNACILWGLSLRFTQDSVLAAFIYSSVINFSKFTFTELCPFLPSYVWIFKAKAWKSDHQGQLFTSVEYASLSLLWILFLLQLFSLLNYFAVSSFSSQSIKISFLLKKFFHQLRPPNSDSESSIATLNKDMKTSNCPQITQLLRTQIFVSIHCLF